MVRIHTMSSSTKTSRQWAKSLFYPTFECYVSANPLGKSHPAFPQFPLTSPHRFDETEFVTPPPESSIGKQHPVFFCGILRIESLDWLSEQGLRYLEADLRNYDSKIHLEHNQSGLTLKNLYGHSPFGERLYIKVEVVYEKFMLAAYLTCEHPLINNHPVID